MRPDQWVVPLPRPCLEEIDAVVKSLRSSGTGPIEALEPARFRLASCGKLMETVHAKLVDGPGLAVVDRVPVEEYSAEESKAIGWLLAGILGRVVAQKWDGTRLYDVKDSGQPLGYGIRRSVTNLGQPFHTDGPWLWQPPSFVGLFCLATARAGGESRVRSLVAAHNAMRARHPRLLGRLDAPVHWDRQAEHGPDEARWSTHPVFACDGSALAARYYDDYITNGQKLAGEPLTSRGSTRSPPSARSSTRPRSGWSSESSRASSST